MGTICKWSDRSHDSLMKGLSGRECKTDKSENKFRRAGRVGGSSRSLEDDVTIGRIVSMVASSRVTVMISLYWTRWSFLAISVFRKPFWVRNGISCRNFCDIRDE